MQKYDLLIVGGGMVGLTLALAVRKLTQLTVAIVEPNEPEDLTLEPELRVSAINAASQQIFSELDVWQSIVDARVQPYRHMHVWDKDSVGALDFDISDLSAARGREALGYIIENKVIRNALWQQAELDSGISLHTGEPLQSIAIGDHEVFASFTQQSPIMAKMVIGGDGANSWLRKQLEMPMAFRDYDNHAIVATVDVAQGHQNTAWQVFLPEGPLAFLPLFNDNQCSIVWSTSPDKAKHINQLSFEEVAKELTAASDGKLGTISVASKLMTFPLTMRLAHQFTKGRAVLIGDAAHTIHPLAGQGVNLGLLDAVALAESLIDVDVNGDVTRPLAHYSRWRRAGAADMVAAMELIKQAFAPQNPLMKLARGIGMAAISNIAPVKELLINQALGFNGDLPKLAKK
ncbi:monooxygenase [Thalassotalea sp. M1531]|uniref:Monooxygenase n=1 Tax=Thalassotalea algicola TaxID=2716224 RepID=A0A7Y0LBJ4_9GAMM|nr:FAD-dependent monooxygenase [Thalassotalea algicola]NMP31107.1 monooxygenase [Thalassotalea algicola]